MISEGELQYQELLCTNVCVLSQSAQFPVRENHLFGNYIPQANSCYRLETLTKQNWKKRACRRKKSEQLLCVCGKKF